MLAAREVVTRLRPARLLAGLAVAGLFGCVHQHTAPAPPPAAAPVLPAPGLSPPPSPSAQSPPAAGTTPPAPAAASASRTPVAATPPAAAGHARAAPGTATAVSTPKRPASASAPGPAAASAPGAAAPPVTPALDLTSLEQRLRDTHAIGLFTKLSLKNQVDDLLAQFRAFYSGGAGLTLEALRRSYELLLMKVVTLLQDDDPGLASAVSSSREAIWTILSDRSRFNNL